MFNQIILFQRWLFQEVGCQVSGFIMYFVGCSSIYFMTAISIERYYIIYRPMSVKKITLKYKLASIGLCLLFGIIWPIMPLIGWSRYTLESGLTSCTVAWTSRSFNVVSYNVTILFTVFLIPFVSIAFTNLKLVLIVRIKCVFFFLIKIFY